MFPLIRKLLVNKNINKNLNSNVKLYLFDCFKRYLQTGIVGLPNVGKSTLFNALVGSMQAQAENYPFCTIEPNVGVVTVPDKRLNVLGKINKSERVLQTTMEFVDIAGIVKGASEGAGLGNKFLSNIRSTDAIVQVVRCFEDSKIIHVDGSVNPERDIEVINMELILADMAQIERRLAKCSRDQKTFEEEINVLTKIQQQLDQGLPATSANLTTKEIDVVKNLMLLTMKKVIYAANVSDSDLATGNNLSKIVEEYAKKTNNKFVIVSAQVESELVNFDENERNDFLSQLNVTDEDCGLKSLVREAYDTLNLQTFYTSGPIETRAWTIKKGLMAPEAGGLIHTDIQKGFIRAEVCDYKNYVESGGEANAKKNGFVRLEGKSYVMQDGDVVFFRFNNQ